MKKSRLWSYLSSHVVWLKLDVQAPKTHAALMAFGVTCEPGRVVRDCTFPWHEDDEIFLLFVWIHILQQGIWDIETRKLSRPVQENP
jgi:hypothetical protein